MKKIVLLRHGESVWNKENRFTGWTVVDLTEKGIEEANKAGITLREYGFNFDKAYNLLLETCGENDELRVGRDGSGLDSGRKELAIE